MNPFMPSRILFSFKDIRLDSQWRMRDLNPEENWPERSRSAGILLPLTSHADVFLQFLHSRRLALPSPSPPPPVKRCARLSFLLDGIRVCAHSPWPRTDSPLSSGPPHVFTALIVSPFHRPGDTPDAQLPTGSGALVFMNGPPGVLQIPQGEYLSVLIQSGHWCRFLPGNFFSDSRVVKTAPLTWPGILFLRSGQARARCRGQERPQDPRSDAWASEVVRYLPPSFKVVEDSPELETKSPLSTHSIANPVLSS